MRNQYDLMFGGIWLSELGARVNGAPSIELAEKDFEFVTIPGKDGDDVIDGGRYKNVEFTRQISLISKNGDSAADKVQKLINAFAYLNGYCAFKDTDHPGLETEAVLQNFSSVVRELRRFQTAELVFSRKPFWYLPEGLEEQTIFDGVTSQSFRSPLLAPTRPKIIFDVTYTTLPYGTFTVNLSIMSTKNGVSVTEEFLQLVEVYPDVTHVVLDFEERILCTLKSDGTPRHYFSTGGLPTEIGTNPVITNNSTCGAVTLNGVTWIPRWRCL